jgi:hypothetical protein
MGKSGKLENMLNKGKKGVKKALIGGAMVLGGLGIGNAVNAQNYVSLDSTKYQDEKRVDVGKYHNVPERYKALLEGSMYNSAKKSTNSISSTDDDITYVYLGAAEYEDLNWRGSGDSDGDDTLTWNDAVVLRDYLEGNYTPDPNDKRFLLRVDNPDWNDLAMLENHFQEHPFSVPSWYYNKSTTKQEKDLYVQQALGFDGTSEVSPLDENNVPVRDCRYYSNQTMINLPGFTSPEDISNLNQVYPFDWTMDGSDPVPLYEVLIMDFDENNNFIGSHEMNATYTGVNNFAWDSYSSWNFSEPQNDATNVQPGEQYIIGQNAKMYIRKKPTLGVVEYPVGGNEIIMTPLVSFELHNLIPSQGVSEENHPLNEGKLKIIFGDNEAPQITTSIKNGGTYSPGSIQTVTLSDDVRTKMGCYSDDGGLTRIALSEGVNNITLPDTEGDFERIFYVRDHYDKDVEKRVNFTIQEQEDTIPPEISWNVSASGQHGNDISIDWNIEEPNYVFETSWIDHNGEKENINKTGSKQYNNLPNGLHTFKIISIDKGGNADSVYQERQITGVGLEDKLQNSKLLIYPNPATEIVTIKSKEGVDAYVRTYDMSGKLVGEIFDNNKDGKTEMDVSGLPPSTYIINMTTPQGEILGNSKLVKQ